jgi:hypothetical protein
MAGRARFMSGCGAAAKHPLTLPITKVDLAPLYWRKNVFFAGNNPAMSETSSSATPSMPGSAHREPSDQALAQVEKWMTLIREIARERQAPTIIPSDDPSHKE